eukprot:971410-Rhodomonas_salina.1
MEITVHRHVNAAGRRGFGVVAHKIMERWMPMRVSVTLNHKAINLFQNIARVLQLRCITSVSMHAEYWPYAVDAVRL